MPYKDKEKQLKAQRDAMDKLRGSQKGSQDTGSQDEGSHYPAIIHALIDPAKRLATM